MTTSSPPVALSIAGSDPSGGAGLQADLKTFQRYEVFGATAVTLLTVQNTRGVSGIEFVAPEFVGAQIDAVVSDLPVRAAKTGALGTAAMVALVAARLERAAFPVVVDPVLVSKHGSPLVADDVIDAVRTLLLPCAAIVTPNLAEAERLAGIAIDDVASMERAARTIASFGARSVLVKAGHRATGACDLLLTDGAAHVFAEERIDSQHTHGTGCVLSAAITARLALGGSVVDAVREARRHVRAAIRSAPGLGGGRGPIDFFARLDGRCR
jgi:hydroxymethylpyrimidine/phosphomethylpyrimidine kinase